MSYSRKLLYLVLATVALNYAIFTIPFHGDEVQGLLHNRVIRDLSSFAERMLSARGLFQRPLSVLSYALNYRISADAPWSYHLVNLLIHLVTTVLIFAIAQSLRLAPLLAAAVFTLHPLSTSCVAQIYGRNYSLGTLWMLLALLLIVRRRQQDRLSVKEVGIQLGLWLLMLSSKQVFLYYPLIAGVLLRHTSPSSDARVKVPTIAWGVLSVLFLVILAGMLYVHVLPHLANAPVSPYVYGVSQLANAPQILVFHYLVPLNFSLFHEFPWHYSLFSGSKPLLGLIAVLSLSLLTYIRRNEAMGVFLLCFLLALIPTNSILPKSEVLLEWRLYPSLSFFALLVSALYSHVESVWQDIRYGRLFFFTTQLYLALLIVVSAATVLRQNSIYQDTERTYAQVLSRYPDSAVAANGLGYYYLKRQDYENARQYLERAHQLQPQYRRSIANLYLLYSQTGNATRAKEMRQKLIQ